MVDVVVDGGSGVGFQIDSIYAFVAVHDDSDEGIIALTIGNMTMPMIAADLARLQELLPRVQAMAKLTDKPIRLVRFTQREVLETINGEG